MTPNSSLVCSTEASSSAADLCWQVAVRHMGRCCGKVALAQMGEKARMLGPRSSAVAVGSTLFQNINTFRLTATLRAVPWPVPAAPAMRLRFGVCSLVDVTFVFVGCLFISWAKRHWEIWTRDPLAENQWWKLNFLWHSWWYKWELHERMSFRLNLSVARDAEDTDLGQARRFHFRPLAQMTSWSLREKADEHSSMAEWPQRRKPL